MRGRRHFTQIWGSISKGGNIHVMSVDLLVVSSLNSIRYHLCAAKTFNVSKGQNSVQNHTHFEQHRAAAGI